MTGSTLRHYLGRSGGHYAARGANQDGQDWVIVDGAVVSRTGDEIFYVDGERRIVSVAVEPGEELVLGDPSWDVPGKGKNNNTGRVVVFYPPNQ